MQKDTLMADCHLARTLLGAPLNAQLEIHIEPDFGIYTAALRLRCTRSDALAQACSARYQR
ncbi:hypothetical protein [Limnohabitans sp. Rim8]|uniref:hypothetical protein n=1 Tax=Limnohabitans sp. Rim8 TaxID=1100718 RepID=UPI0033055FB6